MRLIFVTTNAPLSWFIRWFTFSEYSHVALVKGQTVISADLFGVQIHRLKDFKAKYRKVLLCSVDIPDEEKAWTFALEQIRKPYDFTALFGFLFRRDWQEPDSWFCSELVASTLLAGGLEVIRRKTNRITPQDLLNSPLVQPISIP